MTYLSITFSYHKTIITFNDVNNFVPSWKQLAPTALDHDIHISTK